MKIEHVALWTKDIERMREFYEKYFHATSNKKYCNEKKSFSSYFLSFKDGARLELMHHPQVEYSIAGEYPMGWAHIAFSVGSEQEVDNLTEQLRQDGYTIYSNPRITGDGYYESGILDPDGNKIEITV